MGNATRIPFGLVAAVVLVVAAERGVFRPLGEDSPFIPASWRESRRAASREAIGAEVLCFGDSQAKCGLQPKALGRPSFNLAVIGGQAASTYRLFRLAIEAGARPRAVVVDYFPGLLASGCEINHRQWPELLEPVDCLDLIRTARDPKLLAPLATRLILPSFRMREEIRATVSSAFLGVTEKGRDEGRAEGAGIQLSFWRS